MKTLVVDRSTSLMSVAWLEEEKIIAKDEFHELTSHGAEPIVFLKEFMARQGGADGADQIIVGTGPGSFAGIRTVLSFAQGYALGKTCEVKGLSSAYALGAGKTTVIGDARRGLYWVARFTDYQLESPIQTYAWDNLPQVVGTDSEIVTVDEERIGEKLAAQFGAQYAGGRNPTAEGLACAFLAHPEVLVNEPLPFYLCPAVRVS